MFEKFFRFRSDFEDTLHKINPPRISWILRTQKFVWHPYKDVRFGIYSRRVIQLVCGTHTAHPRFAKNARRMEVRNVSTSFLSAYFKKYSHWAEVRRNERETSKDEANGTLSTVPTNNCQRRKNAFLYVYHCARLGSAQLGSARLDSLSFVLFRIDLRLVYDSCAMTEIDDCGAANGAGVGSRLCSCSLCSFFQF